MRFRRCLVIATASLALTWATMSPPALARSGVGQASSGDEAPPRHPIPEFRGWTPAAAVGAAGRSASAAGTLKLRAEPNGHGIDYHDASRFTTLSSAIDNPGEACWYPEPFVTHYSGEHIEIADLGDLVRSSAAVVLGTVTGLQAGFDEVAGPGLLVQVEVARLLVSPAENPPADIVHFYYPVGEFRVGRARICATAKDDGFPDPPAVGAEILLFPRSMHERNSSYLLMNSPAGWLAFDTATGMRAPESARQLTVFRLTDFKMLVRETRRAIRRAEGR